MKRKITYKHLTNVDHVIEEVHEKVIQEARTYGGALPKSDLLREYNIKGPFDSDKLEILRDER